MTKNHHLPQLGLSLGGQVYASEPRGLPIVTQAAVSTKETQIMFTRKFSKKSSLAILTAGAMTLAVISTLAGRADGQTITFTKIADTSTPIPGGSGNSLAWDLGCLDPAEAAKRITAGRCAPLDVLHVSNGIGDTWCFNIVGWGMVRSINALAERRMRWMGGVRYTVATLVKLLDLEVLAGRIVTEEMESTGEDFDVVLKRDQELGYAEADPTFDVEGIDAAHKLALLTAMAFGAELTFEDIPTEGIRGLLPVDFELAAEFGYRIKLLGIAKCHRDADGSERIEARVQPTMVPASSLLAKVDGAMNAIEVRGNAVGPTFYSGAGAGEMPTASAVVADLMEIARRFDAANPGALRRFRISRSTSHPNRWCQTRSSPVVHSCV